MHSRARDECRRTDEVITAMCDLIEDMLEEAPSRPDATEVYRRARETLRTAGQSHDSHGVGFPEILRDASNPTFYRHQSNSSLNIIFHSRPESLDSTTSEGSVRT